MRKMIAGFLASAMIASMGAAMALAADTNATFTMTLDAADVVEDTTADTSLAADAALAAGAAKLTLSTNAGENFVFSSRKELAQGADKDAIANAFHGAQATTRINGVMYTVTLSQDAGTLNQLNASISPAGKVDFTLGAASWSPLQGDANNGQIEIKSTTAPVVSAMSNGVGGVLEDNDADRTYVVGQILYAHGNTPVAMVDDAKLINDNHDGVKSGSTIYFMLNDPYSNDDLFKVRVTKGDNSKNVKSISVVEKYFNDNLIEVNESRTVVPTKGKRLTVIKVELKELYTDDEYKVTFDLRVTPTSKGSEIYENFSAQSFKESDIGTVWLKNAVANADNEFRVGLEGLMLQPLENDTNEIVWYDENNDLAKLSFYADSDVDKFYSKLSTKWEHADYATYFNDQDAFIFDFTGSPKISATSRGTLDIYNPFIDEDGNETVDPQSIVIYQVVDGDLFDITDQFTYGENEDGYMAFSTRTRFLGTYIFAEKAVDLGSDETPEELPSEIPSSPEDGSQSGGKQPANTGRYE